MREGTCVACSEKLPLSRMFFVRKGVHCPTCVDVMMKDPHVPLKVGELRPLVDPTVCASCEADGSDELRVVSGLRLCAVCIGRLKRPPIPASIVAFWLTLAAALAFAAERAVTWGVSARDLDRAAAALDGGRIPEARSILASQPPSEELTLLQIRLDLLDDKFADAYARKLTGRWVRGGLARSVSDQRDKARTALGESFLAVRALAEGKIGQAYGAISQARQHYPQSLQISFAFLYIAGLDAFSRKEYDRYIEAHTILGEEWPDHADAQFSMAAAQAARWALKGDEAAKKRALDVLARFKDRAPAFEKFVRDRIETRAIVGFEEFERR